MVVLTIIAPSNDYTVYFHQPLQPNYIRLLSCSLYNSWFNIKKVGRLKSITHNKTITFLPGNYTLKSLASKIENDLLPDSDSLKAEINTPYGQMVVLNTNLEEFQIDENLSSLLGFGVVGNLPKFFSLLYSKKLNSTSTYLIHCDLIDKQENQFNGKPSTILANFDIKGEPWEKVFYQSEPQHVRATLKSREVNSLTISVKDENGELFDFNEMPLTFVLEIN